MYTQDFPQDGVSVTLHPVGHEIGVHDAEHILCHKPPGNLCIDVNIIQSQALHGGLVSVSGRAQEHHPVPGLLPPSLLHLLALHDRKKDGAGIAKSRQRHRAKLQSVSGELSLFDVLHSVLQVEDQADAHLHILADSHIGLPVHPLLNDDVRVGGDAASDEIGIIVLSVKCLAHIHIPAHGNSYTCPTFSLIFAEVCLLVKRNQFMAGIVAFYPLQKFI